MKTKFLFAVLLIVSLTACRQKQDLSLKQMTFLANAEATLTSDLSAELGGKVKIQSISLKDTSWTEPNTYNDSTLRKMDMEYSKLITPAEMPSDEEFLIAMEKVENLKKKMNDYKKNHKVPWGYKAVVAFKINGKPDTVTCELNSYGTKARAYNHGTSFPMEEISRLLELSNK